jgi:hypothetical protein
MSDILVTLSGLVSEFARLSGDQYCAGLWKKDLVRGLLWRREDLPRHYISGNALKKGYKDALSWSWAGVQGGNTEWFHHGSRMI